MKSDRSADFIRNMTAEAEAEPAPPVAVPLAPRRSKATELRPYRRRHRGRPQAYWRLCRRGDGREGSFIEGALQPRQFRAYQACY